MAKGPHDTLPEGGEGELVGEKTQPVPFDLGAEKTLDVSAEMTQPLQPAPIEGEDTGSWNSPSMWEEITVRTTLDLPPVEATPEALAERDTLQVLESTAGSATDALEWRAELVSDGCDTLSGFEEDELRGGLVAVGAAVTHRGLVREGNEDAFLVWPEANLAVVADGMGGHQAGEVASALAVEHIRETLGARETPTDTLAAQLALSQAIREANERICTLSMDDEAYAGMGTTVVALWMLGQKALVVHVGDSRLYRIRRFEMEQITHDHSLLNELRRHGIVTEAQAMTDPRRHVLTRALGGKAEITVDATILDLREGDRFILCTDGLSDIVDEKIIRAFGGPPRAPSTAARTLLEAALANGGKDNVTVVVVEVESAE